MKDRTTPFAKSRSMEHEKHAEFAWSRYRASSSLGFSALGMGFPSGQYERYFDVATKAQNIAQRGALQLLTNGISYRF